ncbi:transport associated protein [Desulfosarcina variabilis str. Montpellier]
MTMMVLYILLVLMIVGSIIAVEIKDLLSSVVALGAVGLGLSIVFLLLKAPDVALTQIVVEIFMVIILIRATLRRDLESSPTRSRPLGAVFAIGFIAILMMIATTSFKDLPTFGEPAMRVAATYLEQGLSKTGAGNLVAAVMLDFRGYDTLGEATVLFTAVIGVSAVVRRIGRKKANRLKGRENA